MRSHVVLPRAWMGSFVMAAALVVCVVGGCKSENEREPSALDQPEPHDPMAFRTHLLNSIPAVLDQTTCACCNKPLSLCYQETLEGQRIGCPDT